MEIQLNRPSPKSPCFLACSCPDEKSGFRAAVAGRMTIPHMSSILWCGKAQKKNYPQLATMDGILFTILQMEFTLPNYDGW